MKKLIISCLLATVLTLVGFTQDIFAAESTDAKPSIVFIYSNNMGKSGPGKSYDNGIKADIQKKFMQTFSGTYNVILGDTYLKKMNETGMTDLSTAERADILPFFKDDNISYVVIFETLPMNSVVSNVSTSSYNGIPISVPVYDDTSFIHLKLIDIQHDKYLYNGKFSYNSHWASVAGHITKCYKDAESQVLIPKLLGTQPGSSDGK